ncbi:hypothetical protein KEM55_007458, partial [Ascosphaera atra]
MHTETVNVSERTRDTVASHGPEKGVKCTWLLAEEIPGSVMGSGRLWDLVLWLWLDSMNKIGELDSILDEEHRDVVANDICS